MRRSCRKISNWKENLRNRLKSAGVSSIEVDRPGNKLRVTIPALRGLGIIIGRKGAEIEKLKQDMGSRRPSAKSSSTFRKCTSRNSMRSSCRNRSGCSSKSVWLSPPRDAEGRRLRRCAFGCKGNQGARVRPSGTARRSRAANGICRGSFRCTLCASDIDYGFSEAHTTYGVIGIKTWRFIVLVFLDLTNWLCCLSPESAPNAQRAPRPGGSWGSAASRRCGREDQ